MRSILLGFFVLMSGCHGVQTQRCVTLVERVDETPWHVNVTASSRKSCPGYRLTLTTYDERNITFRVNFTSHIVDNAPPFGFSVRTDGMRDFDSLGVDGHLRVEKVSGLFLDPSSKIETTNDGDFRVRWRIAIQGKNPIRRIEIPAKGGELTLHPLSGKECGQLYDILATQPAYGSEGADAIPSFENFKAWCMEQWVVNKEGVLLQKVLDVGEGTIARLKAMHRDDLAVFLSRGEDLSKKPVVSGRECRIRIGTLWPGHRVSSEWTGAVIVRKLNKEPYERTVHQQEIHVGPGVYRFKIIDRAGHGISRPVRCRGEAIHVLIPITPHI